MQKCHVTILVWHCLTLVRSSTQITSVALHIDNEQGCCKCNDGKTILYDRRFSETTVCSVIDILSLETIKITNEQ
jgi:hypothetical protein